VLLVAAFFKDKCIYSRDHHGPNSILLESCTALCMGLVKDLYTHFSHQHFALAHFLAYYLPLVEHDCHNFCYNPNILKNNDYTIDA